MTNAILAKELMARIQGILQQTATEAAPLTVLLSSPFVAHFWEHP